MPDWWWWIDDVGMLVLLAGLYALIDLANRKAELRAKSLSRRVAKLEAEVDALIRLGA